MLPILMYDSELYPHPTTPGKRMCKMGNGSLGGSNEKKVAEIRGIRELEEAMRRKRTRWAASVYSHRLLELREVVGEILAENVDPDTILRWLQDHR